MNGNPILFLCSSHMALEIESLYYLKDLGKVLNLEDSRLKDDEIQRYQEKQYIICNVKDPEQVAKLRFIPRERVVTVCVLRKYESSAEPWVLKVKPDHIIKDLGFMKECRTANELYTFIQHLSKFKAPDGDSAFYLKKAWSFLSSCLSRRD
jgi:hypothetical protein